MGVDDILNELERETVPAGGPPMTQQGNRNNNNKPRGGRGPANAINIDL